MKFSKMFGTKIENVAKISFENLRSGEECGIGRSRRELSNDYLIVTFGFDTAENGLF